MDGNDLISQLKNFIIEENKKLTHILKTEVDEIKNLLTTQEQKIKDLKEENKELTSKLRTLEKKLNKNNIIIFNSQYKDGDVLEFTINLFKKHLEINNITELDINNIYAVGEENKTIFVHFCSYLKKALVLRNCKKLKDSGISISEELSQEEREQRKVLVKYMKEARKHDKKSYIYKEKLYINEECYTYEEIIKNEEENDINIIDAIDDNSKKTDVLPETSQKLERNKGKRKAEGKEEVNQNKTTTWQLPNLRSQAKSAKSNSRI